MYPVSGGVGCIVVAVRLPQLRAQIVDMVRRLRWHGAAQLEFKWDQVRREFSLIEINPRFWGTPGLPAMDFPATTS